MRRQQKVPICPDAVAVAFSKSPASELYLRGIDLFIHNAHATVWMASVNEADFPALRSLLEEDDLALAKKRDEAR